MINNKTDEGLGGTPKREEASFNKGNDDTHNHQQNTDRRAWKKVEGQFGLP
jgi:hypothetical protein